jgi:hypothetical protein
MPMMSKLAQEIGIAALSLSVLAGPSQGDVPGSGPPAARSLAQFPDYQRYGPYSLPQAQAKAEQIRRDYPRAIVRVVRENDGWYVHALYR